MATLSDDDVEMWTVHAEGDKEHGDLGSRLIRGYGTTAERQREVLEIVFRKIGNLDRGAGIAQLPGEEAGLAGCGR